MSLLRTIIRGLLLEELQATSELSELEKGSIRDELRKARMFKNTSLDLDDFIENEDNVESWKKILSHGSIKYLGSGRQGSAFSLGPNRVLKIEPGPPRAAEIEAALYSGSDVGAGLPSVLSTGVFDSPAGPIGWSIIEKVETKVKTAGEIGEDPEWKMLWRAVSDGIEKIVKQEQQAIKDYEKSLKKKGMSREEISAMMTYAANSGLPGAVPTKFADRNPAAVAKMLLPLIPQDVMSSVAERYMLASNWFEKFIKGVQNHYKLGMVDFKPDNMGIRRPVGGGPGEVIFFDAASAKLRDIKKWEPK